MRPTQTKISTLIADTRATTLLLNRLTGAVLTVLGIILIAVNYWPL